MADWRLKKLGNSRIAEVIDGINDEQEQIRGHGKRIRQIIVCDTLRRMQLTGTITTEQKLAGDAFRIDFQTGGLHGIQQSGMEKIDHHGSDGPTMRVIASRDRIMKDIAALGGINSPAANIAWEVLGNETSLREWAQIHGKPRDMGSGLLIAALTIIAMRRGITENHRQERRTVSFRPVRVST